MNAQISKEFTANEANSTLRGLVKTLCNAISDFSDSEDGELVEDGQGFKALCDSGERALICANSIPNPDIETHALHRINVLASQNERLVRALTTIAKLIPSDINAACIAVDIAKDAICDYQLPKDQQPSSH